MAHRDMQIGVNDVGFRQGVTAVERLRTYSGRAFAVDAHLARWNSTLTQLGITGSPAVSTVRSLIADLLDRNKSLTASERDVGITMFATPGEPGSDNPTFGLHLNPLNHPVNRRRQEHGQPLILTGVRQPDPACWPRSIKVRSRVHYYRADAIARARHEDAVGILIDNDGTVTETSIANLAMVRSGKIISPPATRVLGGITQSFAELLANDASIPWAKSPITGQQLRQADEVLMMGTDSGIWYACSIDEQQIGDGSPGKIYCCLRERFEDLVRR